MGVAKLVGLYERSGIYGVRFRIDQKLVDVAGRTHWQRSLKTKDYATAIARYVEALSAFERDKLLWASHSKDTTIPLPYTEDEVRILFNEIFRIDSRTVEDVSHSIYIDLYVGSHFGQSTFTIDNVLEAIKWLAFDGDLHAIGGRHSCIHRIKMALGIFDNPPPEAEKIIKRYVAKFTLEIFTVYVRKHISSLANGITDTILTNKKTKEKTLNEVTTEFLANTRQPRKEGTIKGYLVIIRLLESAFGKNRIVDDITRDQCKKIATDLQKLPKNYVKTKVIKEYALQNSMMVEDLTLEMLIGIQQQKGLVTISEARANVYISLMSTIFNYCMDEGYIKVNPAKKLTIANPKSSHAPRGPFMAQQLRKIFATPVYTGCRSYSKWKQAGNLSLRDSNRFWVPLIALYSGMRLNEICMLLSSDIKFKSGCNIIMLRLFDDEGAYRNDASLKTEASERYIPIHPKLVELGFLKFVDMRKQNGDRLLFPDIPNSKDGYKSSIFSKWYQRYLSEYDCKRNEDGLKTVFHSFRHNFRDACRVVGIEKPIVQALGGWEGRNDQEVSEGYGRGYPIEVLAENMAKIYYDIDLDHLIEGNVYD